MNLTIVLEGLRQDLQGLAELGDERSAAIAERLGDALASNLRLKLYDLLAQAALELSSKLPAGHVEVRLAGQEPELVFVEEAGEGSAGVSGEELSARISLRLPESLKSAVERAAAAEGVSTNTWLVRAIARQTESRATRSVGKRLTGYARS
ncbi:MAG TPA: toxin-antitoxin system HicB family antitoxin [Gaiellaceae bacterium]|nr:toxin-antitoxin system HicB family antitoxin [Gaiellaceae bacterium]